MPREGATCFIDQEADVVDGLLRFIAGGDY